MVNTTVEVGRRLATGEAEEEDMQPTEVTLTLTPSLFLRSLSSPIIIAPSPLSVSQLPSSLLSRPPFLPHAFRFPKPRPRFVYASFSPAFILLPH